MFETVTIEKLVHGGQALGTLPDGKRAFVWNALPGELVQARIVKKKRGHIEAVAETIVTAAADRIPPRDEAYLSTSPWQILPLAAEDMYKQDILAETYAREHVAYPKAVPVISKGSEWHYRNKMEYSFYGDDDGLHLALFNRGSHGKRIIQGSSIAQPAIDAIANSVLDTLSKHDIRGSQLKTVVVRTSQSGESVVALFVKDENFPKLDELADVAKGMTVCYSTPKSPASVLTRELYTFGDVTLTDVIGGTDITYDVHSFFQVNLPVFSAALEQIKSFSAAALPVVDMYAGVGTIGIPVGADTLVEIDSHNIAMASSNSSGLDVRVVEASAEKALDYIPSTGTLIVDPPRAGLHTKVVERILEVLPDQMAYLSCNPITQARDLALLQDQYEIVSITGYNFFPKTPHIEALAFLVKRYN